VVSTRNQYLHFSGSRRPNSATTSLHSLRPHASSAFVLEPYKPYKISGYSVQLNCLLPPPPPHPPAAHTARQVMHTCFRCSRCIQSMEYTMNSAILKYVSITRIGPVPRLCGSLLHRKLRILLEKSWQKIHPNTPLNLENVRKYFR
jgi:hypothetical protein